MKKIFLSVFACTAVFAFIACGKTAATGNSATTSATTTSTQTEDVQKPTRVNEEPQLSAGSPRYTPIDHSRFWETTTSVLLVVVSQNLE